jgi:CDP-glycerol glycerophosphotransferase
MPTPLVSVVMPVHNAMPYLLKGLQSVVDQTIGAERIELVAVDDGSTDESGDALDAFAADHPELVTAVHQEASGGLGAPRNRGLDLARGEYVFFLDADDHLGAEALERMVATADEQGSDVVLGRMAGANGRGVPESMFKRAQLATDAFHSRAFWTLDPCKLFRRSLIERLGLRFEPGVHTGEDLPFTVAAYPTASNISILADYCYVVKRDGRNATAGVWADPQTRGKFGTSLGKPMLGRSRPSHTVRLPGSAPVTARQYCTDDRGRLAVRVAASPRPLRRLVRGLRRRFLHRSTPKPENR